MRRTCRSSLAILAVALLLPGCATVFNGKRQQLIVESDPPGASASWNGQRAETPGRLVVPRKLENVRIRFEKPGYDACAVTLKRHRSGLFWVNLALIPVGIAAGASVGANAGAQDLSVFRRAWIGMGVGGAAMPLMAMAGDSWGGAGYEQNPGKLVVLFSPEASGSAVAEGQEPACRLRGAVPKPSAPVAGKAAGLRTPW